VTRRIRIVIQGAVQGVGFRPFVHRLAKEMALPGWVSNSSQGVFIEVEGELPRLEEFLCRLGEEKPSHAFIQSTEFSFLDPVSFRGFEIRPSDKGGAPVTLVLPDIATCAECLKEVFDLEDRRYLYPFTNCTHCGPRFSIIESLPYDRTVTSMKKFDLCEACREEYENPADRRFHAQPNACPECGPSLELWDETGNILSSRHEALLEAAEAIRSGKILAVKGLGGFQLMVDASDRDAVARLRQRKRREEKPLAVMVSALQSAAEDCEISRLEERLLRSSESPIVLLRKKAGLLKIAPSVAPANPYLGVMLPYTPLHHILLREVALPVVATSGNLTDEPICFDENEALRRLGGVADVFLVHNRPIVRYVDDSVVRVVLGRELVLRRARGYAPLPLRFKGAAKRILAVGGHLKNTIALTVGDNVFVSQHIGDLESAEASEAFRRTVSDFESLYGADYEQVVADRHPDYFSTHFAKTLGVSLVTVQHHHAHVVSCMADNDLEGPVLGVCWDGTGYGTDGNVWGGEFLWANTDSFERAAHFRPFKLPGGDQAVREPRRAALGLLHELLGEVDFEQKAPEVLLESFSESELRVLRQMVVKGLNSPWTTSVGRIFDAVASLTGLRQTCTYEGQAAIELEHALVGGDEAEVYPFRLNESVGSGIVVDWEPALMALLGDVGNNVSIGEISARFHNTLVEVIWKVADRIGEEKVVLTGGCFQNLYLTEKAVRGLESRGFRAYWHQRIPPNDAGISLGQAVAAARIGEGE
jgi:hydrogenase maturation protein HypF